ncbi:MAG: alpha/beta fold hydrolase [Deltaproteobacteria bacterium]|uniref:Alpha/beta fold hydrolase n=1 Tax=Candidatus Zymogenus saltonus TaxID=2844893 RepID=A0A9D8KFX2_9DELT|nr:alpha/beta fold hydrolase [Candidatus Zymogenus saltonus]
MKFVKKAALVLLLIIVLGFGYAIWFFSGEIIRFETATIEEKIAEKKFHDLADYGVKPEEIEFTTLKDPKDVDGEKLTLKGWFIPGKSKESPTFIVLHGQNDNRIGSLKYSGMLARAGYNVLAYDHRYHGLSEGDFCTFGYYESHDVSSAVDYLEKRGDCNLEQLGVLGESMGAAIAIMAAANDDRIKLLIEDSSYPSLPIIVSDYAKALYGLPRFPIVDSALLLAGIRAHFKPSEVAPILAIKEVVVPTLILHCDGDLNIKPEYSTEMYDAAGAEDKEIYFFSGCTHTMGYEDYTDMYEELVLSFIKKRWP